jgi:hypothetical protein
MTHQSTFRRRPVTESGSSSISNAEILASTIRVLDYVLRLELTEARWVRVDDILAIAVEAGASGDFGTLRAATSQLRAIGPVRIIRIGGTPVGPPPVKVRERVEQVRIAVEAAGSTGDEDGKDSSDDHGPTWQQ